MCICLNTILVDDEIWALEHFKLQCENINRIRLRKCFSSPYKALDFARKNQVDLALLDVNMPGMNGITLAKYLKSIYPNMIIIFVSAYDEYISEAMRIKADYFVLKPYSYKDVEDALFRALLLSKRLEKRVYIRAFGFFEVFIDEKLISFSSIKAKELLALLVDRRGDVLTPEEAFLHLWDDKPYNNYTGAAYRKALAKLVSTLDEHDVSDLLLTYPHGRALNVAACDCDYFCYLTGDLKSRKLFNGEYMSNYSWAKATLTSLINTEHGVSDEEQK